MLSVDGRRGEMKEREIKEIKENFKIPLASALSLCCGLLVSPPSVSSYPFLFLLSLLVCCGAPFLLFLLSWDLDLSVRFFEPCCVSDVLEYPSHVLSALQKFYCFGFTS